MVQLQRNEESLRIILAELGVNSHHVRCLLGGLRWILGDFIHLFIFNIQGDLELDQETNGEPAGRGFPFSDLVAAKKQLEQSAQAEAC